MSDAGAFFYIKKSQQMSSTAPIRDCAGPGASYWCPSATNTASASASASAPQFSGGHGGGGTDGFACVFDSGGVVKDTDARHASAFACRPDAAEQWPAFSFEGGDPCWDRRVVKK